MVEVSLGIFYAHSVKGINSKRQFIYDLKIKKENLDLCNFTLSP